MQKALDKPAGGMLVEAEEHQDAKLDDDGGAGFLKRRWMRSGAAANVNGSMDQVAFGHDP